MKYKIFLLLVFLSFTSFTAAHKFYVSVTEIEYNQKVQSLEIITRVFVDDFENVLRARYKDEIRLGARSETSGADAYIKKYLEQKLTIEVDGKPVDLKYLGKEYENDMILFYIEAPQTKQFNSITIKNTILMDLFEEQKNLVHVELNGRTKSLVLVSGDEKSVIKF